MATSVRIAFADVEFTGAEIKSCEISERFSPLSINVPINTLEFTLFSDNTDFSIINPSGDYEPLLSRQPMAVYAINGSNETYMGQYYLDNWSSPSENLKRFECVDILGIIDKYDYMGGIWLTPTTVGDLLDDVLTEIGVGYEVDPDVASIELTGWIPICSYRDALQQIAFAAGAFVSTARRDVLEIGKMSQVALVTSGVRTGVANAGQSRNWKIRFRKTQDFLFTTGGAVTRGIRSGVPSTGQTRLWKKRFRTSQWDGVKPIIDIAASEEIGRSVTLRPEVSGVEVTAHDIMTGTGSIELFNGTLAVGDHKVTFGQPMHTLTATGASVSESGANYAILTVSTPGTVTLKGLVYIDTKRVFGRYLPYKPNRKENILSVTNASLVSSSNADEICRQIFDYYQQRYVQNMRLVSPYTEIGGVVNANTLYNNTLFGIVESMDTDLTRGNMADTEVVGIIT